MRVIFLLGQRLGRWHLWCVLLCLYVYMNEGQFGGNFNLLTRKRSVNCLGGWPWKPTGLVFIDSVSYKSRPWLDTGCATQQREPNYHIRENSFSFKKVKCLNKVVLESEEGSEFKLKWTEHGSGTKLGLWGTHLHESAHWYLCQRIHQQLTDCLAGAAVKLWLACGVRKLSILVEETFLLLRIPDSSH